MKCWISILLSLKTYARQRTEDVKLVTHLQRTYPTEAWIAAVERSYTYGLYDVNRLEKPDFNIHFWQYF